MDLSIKTETFGQDDQSWLGSSHGTSAAPSITLHSASFTPGTHHPDGYFKSGLALGKITATGLYGPYSAAAVDGREVLAGFLLCAISAAKVNTINVQGALLEHGRVIAARLPIPVDAAGQESAGTRIIFA